MQPQIVVGYDFLKLWLMAIDFAITLKSKLTLILINHKMRLKMELMFQ